MKEDKKYAFKKNVCKMHKRINVLTKATQDELEIPEKISIKLSCDHTVALYAVRDFIKYLKTAFGIIAKIDDKNAFITLEIDNSLCTPAQRKTCVLKDKISICASDARGIAQGLYSLEDKMNLRQGPYLKQGTSDERPAFSPRMVHSGIGVDEFTDEYLSACAHHGFDAVLAFVHEHDKNWKGYYDYDDLIARAARYGIDVYAYCKLKNYMHPEEENAKQVFADVYGGLFKKHAFKGIVFVGESVQFPTKDPNADPLPIAAPSPDGIPTGKPHGGWYPCYDYKEWLTLVRDSIRAVSPKADIVFWTYNWGRQPEEARIKLIENMPSDITLLATFEMFEKLAVGKSNVLVADYSVAFAGPGKYFASEAAAAKKCGLKLYTQANTCGRTWDFGCVPFEPFPSQWNARNQALLKAQKDWGLSGLMESHHFGFIPSFISLLAKGTFTFGTESFEERLKLFANWFAPFEAQKVLDAFCKLDSAIKNTIPSNENQYGPMRIGPAYPFCINKGLKRPNTPQMMFGNAIYRVELLARDASTATFDTPYSIRVFDELKTIKQALADTKKALNILKSIKNKNSELKKLINLVEFIMRHYITTCNFQQFYIYRLRLLAANNKKELFYCADKIEKIAQKEADNVKKTIPLVKKDSALGFEPSMDYQCDEEALNWKLKQLDYLVRVELSPYKKGKNTWE